jgi:hypothetical protein
MLSDEYTGSQIDVAAGSAPTICKRTVEHRQVRSLDPLAALAELRDRLVGIWSDSHPDGGIALSM